MAAPYEVAYSIESSNRVRRVATELIAEGSECPLVSAESLAAAAAAAKAACWEEAAAVADWS